MCVCVLRTYLPHRLLFLPWRFQAPCTARGLAVFLWMVLWMVGLRPRHGIDTGGLACRWNRHLLWQPHPSQRQPQRWPRRRTADSSACSRPGSSIEMAAWCARVTD